MAHLLLNLFSGDSGDPFSPGGMGLWIFLSVGAVCLFVVFIPLVTFMENRRKEREAFYQADTMRRLAEAPGDGAKAALELMRAQDRREQLKKREGLKIGGLVNMAVGAGLCIMLYTMTGPHGPYLVGLIPGFIGVALLVSAFFLSEPQY